VVGAAAGVDRRRRGGEDLLESEGVAVEGARALEVAYVEDNVAELLDLHAPSLLR
jgi:hypothetical protein